MTMTITYLATAASSSFLVTSLLAAQSLPGMGWPARQMSWGGDLIPL